MAQLRSVNTKFWEDPWVESLGVEDKLLFLYLITNRYANLAGVYEITIKRISFETSLTIETIRKGLKGFERVRKAYFVNDNYILLPNWLKNQNLNGNMKKGVIKIISALPIDVKISTLGNHYQTIQNDYQSILNTLLKYEILEDEVLEVLEKEIEEPKGNGSKKEPHVFSFKQSLLDLGVEENIVSDWLKVRKNKKATNTKTSFTKIKNQIEKSAMSANDCIKIAVEKDWKGFESSWLDNLTPPSPQNQNVSKEKVFKTTWS